MEACGVTKTGGEAAVRNNNEMSQQNVFIKDSKEGMQKAYLRSAA